MQVCLTIFTKPQNHSMDNKPTSEERMVLDPDKELLIRLEDKVDMILERLQELPKMEERVRGLEKDTHAMKGDITELKATSKTWSILNSVGVFLASIIGVFWGTK